MDAEGDMWFEMKNDAVGVPCDWTRNEWILKKKFYVSF
jgi:hypothetical protein